MLKIFSIAIILLALASISFGKHHHSNLNLSQATKSEINDYRSSNILPKMLEWKNKIDASLNSTDLNKLNELRELSSSLIENMKSDLLELKNKKKAGEDIDRKDFKQIKKDKHLKFKEIAEKLKPIVDQNNDLLKEIAKESKDFHKKWKMDIREIIEESSQIDDKKRDHKRSHKGADHKKSEGGKKGMMKLLLWNGSDLDFSIENDESSSQIIKNSNAYPNPSNSSSKIEFELMSDDYVTIGIYDETGNLIETLQRGEMKAGMQLINFIPKEMNKSGTYFYRIESKTLNETGKIIINK
ncbi:T9SS type A sorting domain-containing protein [Candidatus Kapabacteria bacterium]|nr:T9SS type A sorting domain-containing protein [Candidatus Kapabacteria bacterium]